MLTPQEVKTRIDGILRRYQARGGAAPSVVPPALTAGKLYEAWVVCSVLERLRVDEGYSIVLRRATNVTLKSAPGPINRTYPYFELTASGSPSLEVWTDIEFMALSHAQRAGFGPPLPGDYHELDVVVVEAGTDGRPTHAQILLGVECKNTGYSKEMLRGILGVRRELSLLVDPVATGFRTWPRAVVPANPPSCLLVYSTDPGVAAYAAPGGVFGIDFIHEPLPTA